MNASVRLPVCIVRSGVMLPLCEAWLPELGIVEDASVAVVDRVPEGEQLLLVYETEARETRPVGLVCQRRNAERRTYETRTYRDGGVRVTQAEKTIYSVLGIQRASVVELDRDRLRARAVLLPPREEDGHLPSPALLELLGQANELMEHPVEPPGIAAWIVAGTLARWRTTFARLQSGPLAEWHTHLAGNQENGLVAFEIHTHS